MAETEKVTMDMESTTAMVEQLGKAFGELESHRDSSSHNKTLWEDIKEHFHNLERSLKKSFDALEEKKGEFEEKQSNTHALLAEKEAAIATKENASLDRLQELKDTAVFSIAEARRKFKVASPEPVDVGESKEKKVSTSTNGDPSAPIPAPGENFPDNRSGEFSETVAVEVKARPQLNQLCEQTDAKGLLKYISENRKILALLRQELSVALKSATVPGRLVLDCLEEFYPPDKLTSQENEKDTALQGLRRACLILMESAAPLLGMTEPGGDDPISTEIKQQAKAIADIWKPKLAGVDTDASNGNTLEAQAFLQLLATFNIAPEFDEDELCKLVVIVSHRRQAPELCRALGLTHKMPGVVEALVTGGKTINAVHFAHAFQLTESFPPVPLLKTYLADSRNAQEKSGNTGAAGVQKDADAQELGALRVVIKCIEEYKLQKEYPLDPLQKRVTQLERAKADKKRMAEAAKFQAKRPRASGGYAHRKHAIAADNRQPPPMAFDERGPYSGVSERYPYAAPPTYEMPSHASYGQQPNLQRPYHYSDERAPASYSASYNYGSYMGSGVQSASSNYGSYMGTGVQSASSNHGNYNDVGLPAASSNYGSYMGTSLPSSHQSYM